MNPTPEPHTPKPAPVDISDTGDVLLTSDLLFTLLTIAITLAALWAAFYLLARTWRLLLLIAAVMFLTCWLPTQCDRPALNYDTPTSEATP